MDPAIRQRFLALGSRAELAAVIGVSDRHLCHVLYGSRERSKYRTFEIPKKKGGTRTISAPPSRLGSLQSKLAEVLYSVFEPRECAHGFARGRSIVSNAAKHCGRNYVLNIDLKDFFPGIHLGRVRGIFEKPPFGLPSAVAKVIGQIACDDAGRLPQGSPLSPIISNMVCGALDTALQRCAQRNACFYTRYVDDLTFSTDRSSMPEDLGSVGSDGTFCVEGSRLESLIEEQGFKVNPEKVWLRSRREHQEVTGLTVNEFPNVTRRLVRQTRAILHNWDTSSLAEAAETFSKKYTPGQPADEEAFRCFVQGRLSFIRMVRGKDDPVYRRLATKHAFIEERLPPDPGGAGPSPLRGLSEDAVGWQRVYDRLRKHIFRLQLIPSSSSDSQARYAGGTAFAYGKALQLATAGHNLDGQNVEVFDIWQLPEDPIIPGSAKWQCHPDGLDCGLIKLKPSVRLKWRGQIPTQERIPEVGEEVAAIGYPPVARRQTAPILYTGVVAALARGYDEKTQFIQVSFRQDPGLSGSPLIDRRGFVLGIVIENTSQPGVAGADQERAEGKGSGKTVQHGQVLPIGYLHRLRKDPWKVIPSG